MTVPAAALLVLAQAGLAAPAAPVRLRHLQHSGWQVDTAHHRLVFDFVGGFADQPAPPAALAPDLAPDAARRLVVFVSHGHADHFDPAVFAWGRARADVTFVLGFDAPGAPAGAVGLGPRQTWSDPHLRVRTTGSTDEGVGFFVEVDGLRLFHAGDHAQWSEGASTAFRDEIEWLARAEPRIDVAWLPIATGHACDPRPAIWSGAAWAAERLRPRTLVPMHVRCADRFAAVYERFAGALGPRLAPATRVIAPRAWGERFRLGPDGLERDDP